MIHRELFRKNLREGALLLVGCTALVAAFSFFRVWVVGRIDTGRFRQIIELLPKDWERFSSVSFEWIISWLGRTAMTLDEPLLMMLVSGWALVRGADVVAGELGRGTMEMLLAQPLSRSRIYWQQVGTNLAGVVFLGLVCWLSMAVAVQVTEVRESTANGLRIPFTGVQIPVPGAEPVVKKMPMREVVSASSFGPGILNLICLGAFLAGMASMISAWDRYGWRATGVCAAVFFLQAMVKIGSLAAAGLAWLGWLTFFSLFEPELHVKLVEQSPGALWQLTAAASQGSPQVVGPLLANGLLLLGRLAMAWIGAVSFERRDLPAPC